MPGILSRFKRSPSVSSSLSDGDPNGQDSTSPSQSRRQSKKDRRASTISSHLSDQDSISTSTTATTVGPRTSASASNSKSPILGAGGSLFVENFGAGTTPVNHSSPSKRQTSKPAPLSVPGSEQKSAQPLGTPKLVLTEEGSNSPRSVSSSPLAQGRPVGLGLGEHRTISDEDLVTPTQHETSFSQTQQQNMSPPALGDEVSRDRASSVISDTGSRSRQGSILSRNRAETISPPLSPHALRPVDSHVSSVSKKSRRKHRTKSISSSTHGIAAALAKGGLHIAGPVSDDLLKSVNSKRQSVKESLKRSPFLSRNRDATEDDNLDHNGNEYGDEDFDADDFDDEDDSDSDLGDDLPVTGFAVASNRRNADFHALFPTIDEGDYLIEDYGCALSKDILVQGRLYVSENHICFHANIFGWVTDVVVAFSDVKVIEKKMTALVIPNAIGVVTPNAKYTFASLINRDSTYDVMLNIWRLCNPNAVMSSVSLAQTTNVNSRPGSVAGDEPDSAGAGAANGKKGHGPTQCACGKDGKHYSETALETTFPSTPEKVYNLMANSGWFKTFLSENQKLRDIEYSDWKPLGDSKTLLTRSITYIKPLNGSIGPKQTKCHIVDEHEYFDLDKYISFITTTRTPDVPSGGVFSVKTRTCLMWAGSNSTKIVVTTTVEWTGKSWVKGIIEKSAIEGQKTYHDDLETGMRAYMKENPTEFAREGGGADEEEDELAAAEASKEKEGESKTEAQAYADKTRRSRKDEDLSLLQAGLDSLVSGLKAIISGITGIFGSIFDLLSDTPLNGQSLMAILIVILVISNIWTYLSIDSAASQQRRAKKIESRIGLRSDLDGDDQLAEAVRRVLQERNPREESAELLRILEDVEKRVERLRSSVLSAASAGASAVADAGAGASGEAKKLVGLD